MIETIHLQLLLATFAGWIGRQQSHVIAYLIEENRVLKEQLESGGRRLRFTDDQRRRLAAKGKPLGRKVLRQIGTIVTPDTILAWLPGAEYERVCGTVREIDQVRVSRSDDLPGRESLVRTIAEYTDERSHQGIGNEMVSGAKAQGKGVVETRERLGGLLKYYHRRAA